MGLVQAVQTIYRVLKQGWWSGFHLLYCSVSRYLRLVLADSDGQVFPLLAMNISLFFHHQNLEVKTDQQLASAVVSH